MSSKNPCRDNGNDNGIDYEQTARDSKAAALSEVLDQTVDDRVNEFLQALENGEDTRQAYLMLCQTMFDFLQMANQDLADLGIVENSDPVNTLLVRSIDTAALAARDRPDLAAAFAVDVVEAVDEASDEDVTEAIAQLEESDSE